jgi:hypothetical protein
VLASFVCVAESPAQSAVPAPTSAAPATYRPGTRNPTGREVVAVFISATFCIANRDSAFKPAVREMMRRLGTQRDSAAQQVSITGVSIDWSARAGAAYLDSLGAFDEVIAGRNWYNSAATRHIWQAAGGVPTIPQVVLLERTVTPGKRGMQITRERELARYVGGDQIEAWVARGARLPTPAARTRRAAGGRPAT